MNPLCSLYRFSCSANASLDTIRGKVKRAIYEYKTVPGFSFARITSVDLPLLEVMDLLHAETDKSPYGHRAIIRYDGYVMGIFLADGREKVFYCPLE